MVSKSRKRRQQRQRKYVEKQKETCNKVDQFEQREDDTVESTMTWDQRKHEVNEKRRSKYWSSPSQRRAKSRYYCSAKSPIKERMRLAYHTNKPTISKQRREKYSQNPSPTQKRMRENYHSNPSPKRHKMRSSYSFNPSPVRQRIRKSYSSNPSPVRQRIRKSYALHHSHIKQRMRKSYALDPSPVRQRMRTNYAVDPSPVRQRMRNAYRRNPSPKRHQVLSAYKCYPKPWIKKILAKYHLNPLAVKHRALSSYYANIDRSRRIRHEKYAENPLPAKKRAAQRYERLHSELLHKAAEKRCASLSTLGVCKKYNRIFKRKGNHHGTASEYVERLVRTMGIRNRAANMIKVQLLVKSGMQQLSFFKHQFIKSFNKLKNNLEASLCKKSDEVLMDSTSLLGINLHTSNTEAFFPQATYNQEAFNEDGSLKCEEFPGYTIKCNIAGKGVSTWECCYDPPWCKLDKTEVIEDRLQSIYHNIIECAPDTARRYIQQIDDCTNQLAKEELLQGHPLHCYIASPPCHSPLLYLRMLAPHFPDIRRVVQMLYEVRRHDRKIAEIEHALKCGDLEKISEIAEIAKTSRLRQFDVDHNPLSETQIYEEHKAAYEKFSERCLDVANYPCISCDKLCYRRECSHLNSLRILPNSCEWQALLEYNENRPEYNDGLPKGYICKYCLNYFRQAKFPPRCILNGLQFGDIPEEISILNAYEKILIQRAKCFQTVTRMGTVAKRQMPASHKIQKVTGTTFHLPLPIEETLKRLPEPQQALPNHGELFILMRSIPSKSNVIWQDLVDVNKVYNALLKLKEINPLYALIQLPGTAEELEIGSLIDAGSYGEPLATSGQAMVEEIAEHEEQSYYEQYTINPLHAPRESKKATALYQMLKINEAPLDSRMKNLDMLCFPDLYPHGIGGQRCQREVLLSAAEYVKCILQSRDPRFRLNQQLIFYLNNQATLRQIASGIYHKLKVIRPSEQLTAARCLEMLLSEEIEGSLTTIFARVRNTESFWTRYRNDLNCMSLHYGPPTWFITLNPGEWLWDDLRAYLISINSSFSTMSISEMTVTDPVSATGFIDNKYKAI